MSDEYTGDVPPPEPAASEEQGPQPSAPNDVEEDAGGATAQTPATPEAQETPPATAAPDQHAEAAATEASTGQAGTDGNEEGEAEPETPPREEPKPPFRVEIGYVDGDLAIHRLTPSGGSQARLQWGMPRGEGVEPISEDHEHVRFARLPDDTQLWVPPLGYEVLIHEIAGDLRAEGLDGLLHVSRIDGDVLLDGVTAAQFSAISGNLRARGGAELQARAVDGDVRVEDYQLPPVLGSISGDVRGRNLAGLELREAIGGSVLVERCGPVLLRGAIGGDLRAEDLSGPVRANTIGGNAEIQAGKDVTLNTVGGDVSGSRLDGRLEVGHVGGDVELHDITGGVRVSTTGGDVKAERVPSGMVVNQTGGDVVLETAFDKDAEYNIQASGDILLRVRGEVNARFVAQTYGGEIRTRLPLTVERGRRRNLVGVLGRGDATVTLRSTGGDIAIAASDMADEYEREYTMSDENSEREDTRTWEGAFGRHRFRIRMDRGPGRAGFHFHGPFDDEEAPPSGRDFSFEWEKGRGGRAYGEYEERLNDLRDKAERVARRAAEQAQRAAERATQRARETDWETMGREIRVGIEKAMADLEDAFASMRRDWETRRPGPQSSSRPSAQRVRIEQDEEPAATATPGADPTAGATETPNTSNATASGAATAEPAETASPLGQEEREARRREILEQLRLGTLSIDEAERRLNDLR